jgi:hypothetical protein
MDDQLRSINFVFDGLQVLLDDLRTSKQGEAANRIQAAMMLCCQFDTPDGQPVIRDHRQCWHWDCLDSIPVAQQRAISPSAHLRCALAGARRQTCCSAGSIHLRIANSCFLASAIHHRKTQITDLTIPTVEVKTPHWLKRPLDAGFQEHL